MFIPLYKEFKICPLNIMLLQISKKVTNSTTDAFLIASNQ